MQVGPVFPAWAIDYADKYSSKCDTETKTGLWLTFEMARRPGAPVISAVLVDGLGYLVESNGQYIRDTLSIRPSKSWFKYMLLDWLKLVAIHYH